MKILERRLGSGSPLGSTCMLEHCNIIPRNSSGCTLAGQMRIPSSTSDQQSPELHLSRFSLLEGGALSSTTLSFTWSHFWRVERGGEFTNSHHSLHCAMTYPGVGLCPSLLFLVDSDKRKRWKSHAGGIFKILKVPSSLTRCNDFLM